MRRGIVSWAMFFACTAAAAAPTTGSGLSSSEQPVGGAGPAPQVATYGLCSGPGNAEAFPSSPVADDKSQCYNTQKFHVTSPNANYGGTCGGYTVAFGPQGDFKRKRKYLWLVGKLGRHAADAGQLRKRARGDRGLGLSLHQRRVHAGAWERIESAKSKKGVWNTTSKTCGLSAQANATLTDYATVNIDVIATQGSGRTAVRKRAAASIFNEHPNGQCPSATYSPRSRP